MGRQTSTISFMFLWPRRENRPSELCTSCVLRGICCGRTTTYQLQDEEGDGRGDERGLRPEQLDVVIRAGTISLSTSVDQSIH